MSRLSRSPRLGMDPTLVESARGRLDTSVTTVNTAIEELEVVREEVESEEVAVWGLEQEIA